MNRLWAQGASHATQENYLSRAVYQLMESSSGLKNLKMKRQEYDSKKFFQGSESGPIKLIAQAGTGRGRGQVTVSYQVAIQSMLR